LERLLSLAAEPGRNIGFRHVAGRLKRTLLTVKAR